MGPRAQTFWASILAPVLTNIVTLDTLFSFLICEMGLWVVEGIHSWGEERGHTYMTLSTMSP